MNTKVYQHPTSGQTVLPVLRELLPYTLPLLKRIEFNHRSSASQILATFFPSSAEEQLNIPKCFAVAFLDRTRRPETECWIFLSGEVPGRCALSSEIGKCIECKEALLVIIDAVKTSDVPKSAHEMDATNVSRTNPVLISSLKGELILFGALHEACVKVIQEHEPGAIAPPPLKGLDTGYMKYLFRPSSLPEPRDLPKDFGWGAVRKQDFALIRNRTSIPRQDATLALLPSLAIFRTDEDDGAPIAWAFLGLDGSLTSLHTEEECRGRGLANMLVSKLFREGGHPDSPAGARSATVEKDDKAWFHADTALDNASSRAVCRALGGQEGWVVHWIRIKTAT
jgi:hypothetical protein